MRCLYRKAPRGAVDSPNFTVYRLVHCTARQYLTRRGLLGHQLDSVGQKVFFWFCPNRMLLACDILQHSDCGILGKSEAPRLALAQSLVTVRFPTQLSSLSLSLICSFTYPSFIHSFLTPVPFPLIRILSFIVIYTFAFTSPLSVSHRLSFPFLNVIGYTL